MGDFVADDGTEFGIGFFFEFAIAEKPPLKTLSEPWPLNVETKNSESRPHFYDIFQRLPTETNQTVQRLTAKGWCDRFISFPQCALLH